jgi:hypothetical protein
VSTDDPPDFDDLTPPAVAVPVPGLGAAPIDFVRYEALTAQLGVRQLGRRLGRNCDDHRLQLAELALWRRGLEGADGDDGKIGQLRADVRTAKKWLSGVAGMAIVSMGSVAFLVFGAGERVGSERNRLEQAERTIQELRLEITQLRADAWRLAPRPATPAGDPHQ